MNHELTINLTDARAMALTDYSNLVVTPEPPEIPGYVKGYAIVPGVRVLTSEPIPVIFNAAGVAVFMLEASEDALEHDGNVLTYKLHNVGEDEPFIRFKMPQEAVTLSTAVERSLL